MKKIVTTAAVTVSALLMAVSCYDDSALNTRLDALQERIASLSDLGDDLMSLRVLISQYENRQCVKQIEEAEDGWRLIFSDGTSAILKNADKGEHGDPGAQGPAGERGPAGEQGATPEISVKQYEGVYYWTINGEWALGSDGNKIAASCVSPQLKIIDGILCASFDNGANWIKCGATTTNCDNSLFSSFENNGSTVVVVLADGTELEFPLEGKFAFIMSEQAHNAVAGDTVKVAYCVSGCATPEIYCYAEGGFAAYLEKTSATEGFVLAPVTVDTESGKVMLFATNGDNTLIRCFEIYQKVLEPCITMVQPPIVTYASIALNYRLDNLKATDKVSCGICWSTAKDPTTKDKCIACNNPDAASIMQAVPAPMIDVDKTYHFRVYMTLGEETSYSEDFACKLADQPEAITFNWAGEPAAAGFPEGVNVYKTTDQLNGCPFNAWYAVADPSKVELRINLEQGTLKTLETQYSQDAEGDKPFVLVNGGYFDGNKGVGRTYINANAATILYDVTGADGQRYSATRGVIGFTKAGVGSAYWSYANYTFPYPMPDIAGQTPYSNPSGYSWMESFSWVPQTGISAGPMLIKDNKILPEFTKTADGYYLNNFEMIASDIYNGKGSDTDRTALGYTADGKIILFICDGRCTLSQGADLDQLARIMKGLGCTNALNLDGGGSTAMLVGGTRVNTTISDYSGNTDNRAVATNIGLYSID